MLIQTIPYNSNYQFKNKTTPSFRGKLGKKVVREISKSENADVSKIMKNLGLGNMGFVSSSKVKDILEEVAKNNEKIKSREEELERKELSFDQRMHKIQEELYEKEQEMNDEIEKKQNQLREQEKEFVEQKEAVQKELEQKEENLLEQAKIRKNELEAKEKELNGLEQKIKNEIRENETEAIRKEEKEKAFENLADKYTEIARTEAELDKREHALISTENIMKQAEIDKIKGDLRILYGIKEDSIQEYSSFGEQMVMVLDILNRHKSALSSAPNPEELDTITDILRNNEGSIDKNMLTFIERILKTVDGKINFQKLCGLVHVAKDKQGNLDFEKSCYIIASLSCKEGSTKEVMDACIKRYNLNSSEKNTPDNHVSAWVNKQICISTKWPKKDDVDDFTNIDFNKCSKDTLIKTLKALKLTTFWINKEEHNEIYNDIQQLVKDLHKIIAEK